MIRFRPLLLSRALAVLLVSCSAVHASTTNNPPDFREIYELIRANLVGVTDAGLNSAAVDGLLAQFDGKVSIADAQSTTVAIEIPPITRIEVFQNNVAYVRVGIVGPQLPGALAIAYRELDATNKLQGLVLDLRFANGDDYSAAAATADLFTSREQTLLDWGSGSARSKTKTNAITMPVAILVNRQTRSAAEALAAVLRETGSSLILGGKTAGTAIIARTFPLKDGRQLSIATATVKLGDGTPLSTQGVQPDIEVAVNLQSERDYFENAYAMPANTNMTTPNLAGVAGETNQLARRPRLSEAELVRQHREGNGGQNGDAPRPSEHKLETPVIRDPALARAVDLLKGLAVVRGSRS